MRLAPLLVLLALAPALHAQPDPTPPQDYYPLEVGNEWVYYESVPIFNQEAYRRRRIVREETMAGQRYVVEEYCGYDLRAPAPEWVCRGELLLRFDPPTASIFSATRPQPERVLYCNLGAAFGTDAPCVPDGRTVFYVDLRVGPVVIGGIPYSVSHIKYRTDLPVDPLPPPFAAGIGLLEPEPIGPLSVSRFEYARVRGVEYGRHPVADEANPTGAALALAASPNPTAGALRLALNLPEAQTVTAEAFDALGRRVWSARLALGAGPQTIPVDARAWAPGVYVVRAVAGEARATVHVVRR